MPRDWNMRANATLIGELHPIVPKSRKRRLPFVFAAFPKCGFRATLGISPNRTARPPLDCGGDLAGQVVFAPIS